MQGVSHTYSQIGFVGVYWSILVWDVRWASAGRVEHAWGRKRNSQCKLHIQISLESSTGLVILATFKPRVTKAVISGERATHTSNEYDIKRRVHGVRDLIRIEALQIRKVCELIQIARERDRILRPAQQR